MRRGLYTIRWLSFAVLVSVCQEAASQLQIETPLYIDTASFIFYDDASVDFQPGAVITTARLQPPGHVIFGSSATVSGAGHGRLVHGYVRKVGSAPFVFPIGWDTLYAPAQISPDGSVVADVAYWKASTPLKGQKAPDIAALAAQEYWHMTGSGLAKVTLSWRPGSQLGSLVPQFDQLTLAGFRIATQRWEAVPSVTDAPSLFGAASTSLQGSVTTAAPVQLEQYRYWTLARRDGCVNAVTAAISGNSGYCQGETALLTASGGSSYLWNTGSTSAGLSITAGGVYTVTVTDANGCTGTASRNITFTDCSIPDVISIGQPGCSGAATGSVTLANLPAGTWVIEQSGASSATYSGTGSQYTITGLAPGVYRFRVRNASGAVSGLTPPFAVIIVRC